MLKNIKIHLHDEESVQSEYEEAFSRTTNDTLQSNKDAFRRNIPNLLPYMTSLKLQNISIFCNKSRQGNIVNISSGRTLYGMNPKEEVSQQVAAFLKNAPKLHDSKGLADEFQATAHQFERTQLFQSAPASMDCLIIFGLGAGYHINQLLQQVNIKHLIIYEPEVQYFQCSILLNNWREVFQLAEQSGTQIYFQVEKDGRQVISDLHELQQTFEVAAIYYYKHYNNIVFNRVNHQLGTEQYRVLSERGLSFSLEESLYDYCPTWTQAADLALWQKIDKVTDKFQSNLNAFKKFYPDIYNTFKDYEPKSWSPFENQQDEVNLIHQDFNAAWYGSSPRRECELSFNAFNKSPNRDGVVLKYDMKKLAHYVHYRFASKAWDLLKEAEDIRGELPEDLQSIIVFGVGSGYQIETLTTNYKVENLFICEPNLDFFYASMYAIDWKAIFEDILKTKKRLYINIGESSGTLIKDLMKQFYNIGPYVLNNTYFYQVYYNAALNDSIAQLREQLQIVISMGEYFDHAYYGIAHTRNSIAKRHRFLCSAPSKKMSYSQKETPIFIIGNGPSIDYSLETLKELQEDAILISCGTSLQVLHRNKITPDFHGEIEQNRTTYDWASLIGDPEYLKQISLISCNGIHPDTAELYKDTFIVFKEGESSTVSTLTVFGEEQFEVLKFAFPTVSNLITNLFTTLGFHNIYFIGVDLGFVDPSAHHSRQSAYYDDSGKARFDYSKANNTALSVPGNFRKSVNTKHEFYIAKQMMEQGIAARSKEVTFYNCSDGARINGAIPLHIENILLSPDVETKTEVLAKIKTELFQDFFDSESISRLDRKFNKKKLVEYLSKIRTVIEQELETPEQARVLIRTQQKLLIDSYRNADSMLFFYLHGTFNYVNAVLTKLSHSSEDEEHLKALLQDFREYWLVCFDEISDCISAKNEQFDTCEYNTMLRQQKYTNPVLKTASFAIVSNCPTVIKGLIALKDVIKTDRNWSEEPAFDFFFCASHITEKYDFVIYFDSITAKGEPVREILPVHVTGRSSTTVVVANEMLSKLNTSEYYVDPFFNYVVLPLTNNSNSPTLRRDIIYLGGFLIDIVQQCFNNCVVSPKYIPFDDNVALKLLKNIGSYQLEYCDQKVFPYFFATSFYSEISDLLPNGDRGSKIRHYDNCDELTLGEVEYNDYIEYITEFCDKYQINFVDPDYTLTLTSKSDFDTMLKE